MKTVIVLAICCLAMVACKEETKDQTTSDPAKTTMEEASKEVAKKTDEVVDKTSEVEEKSTENAGITALPRLVYYTISDA